MAIFKCNLRSFALNAYTTVNVVLPLPGSGHYNAGTEQDMILKPGEKYAVMYLLHGMFGDASSWIRGANIERYASEHRMAVVMPEAYNSYFKDIHLDAGYFTYLTEELPRMVQNIFPITDDPNYTYIAGLSMGGYGAVKAGLNCPEKYAAAISLSGALGDLRLWGREDDPEARWFFDCFGDHGQYFDPDQDELNQVLENLVKAGKKPPRLYVACGTEDELYGENLAFRDFCEKLQVPVTYEEGPGIHNWAFWDQYIQRAMKWIGYDGKFLK